MFTKHTLHTFFFYLNRNRTIRTRIIYHRLKYSSYIHYVHLQLFSFAIERFSSQILWGRLIRNNEPPVKEGLGDLIPVLSKMIELQCRMGNQGPTQRRKHIPKPRVTPQWNGSWIGIYFKARRRRECFSNPMYKRMIDLTEFTQWFELIAVMNCESSNEPFLCHQKTCLGSQTAL